MIFSGLVSHSGDLFVSVFTHLFCCSFNVSRKIDAVLSKWCSTQRVRCKLTPGSGGAGGVTLYNSNKNPLTSEQFQLLESIGFNMADKRKKYDRSVIETRWEER